MSNRTVPTYAVSAHLDRLEMRPTMAKADLKNLEDRWREQVGRAVQRCFLLAGRSQKEAAALIGRDAAQVQRWIAGTERPQFDAIFAVDELRQALVIALAELAGAGVEVETVVRISRRVA